MIKEYIVTYTEDEDEDNKIRFLVRATSQQKAINLTSDFIDENDIHPSINYGFSLWAHERIKFKKPPKIDYTVMEYKDIPDYIQLKGVTDNGDFVDISYLFNGRNKLIRVDKKETDDRWVFLMNRRINHWRGINVAIREEEDQWAKDYTLKILNDREGGLFEALGAITNPKNNSL